MKIDMKSKKSKIVAAIALAGVVIGVTIFVAQGQVNDAENNYISCHSALLSIETNILSDKKTLIDSEAKIQNMNPDKDSLTELKIIIEEIEKSDFKDINNINKNVELSDKFNTELDKIIDTFEGNEDMKNDMELSNNMLFVKSLNSLIDNHMEEYNTMYSEAFNKSISEFPVKLVAKKKGWSNVDSFTSIK